MTGVKAENLVVVEGATSSTRGSRIPSLDGLRALSISLVLSNHALLWALPRNGEHGVRHVALSIFANGHFGVQVFFVISGFLITTLLLQEMRRTGTISLKAFYIRRVFRIFPAYYAMLVVASILGFLHRIPLTSRDLAHAATFTWIYNFNPWNWYLSHTWSLSVEEQFYLAWPGALLILGRRRAIWMAMGLILLAPVARAGLVLTSHGVLHRLCFIVMAGRLDTLMFGCMAALLWESSRFRNAMEQMIRWRVPVVAASVAVGTASVTMLELSLTKNTVFCMFAETVDAAGIILTMLWLMHSTGSMAARVLNSAPLVYVGQLSYGVYIWQQMFLTPTPRGPLQVLPLNLVCAMAMGVASFHLLERPILQLRHKVLQPRETRADALVPAT